MGVGAGRHQDRLVGAGSAEVLIDASPSVDRGGGLVVNGSGGPGKLWRDSADRGREAHRHGVDVVAGNGGDRDALE